MGYLDNSSITVDAILTKRGRELLSQGGTGAFNITQFALGDDEIDYTLFNEDHPNGSQYSGEAIENMPLIEAIPDGENIMIHKLITLNSLKEINYFNEINKYQNFLRNNVVMLITYLFQLEKMKPEDLNGLYHLKINLKN